jgi:hypothetical protein
VTTSLRPLTVRLATSLVAVGLAAGCGANASTGSSSAPTAGPSGGQSTIPGATPVATTSSEPTVMASPSPRRSAAAEQTAARFHVVLTHATRHTVTVDVLDWSNHVTKATSGVPGDGSSVASDTVAVVNDDPKTIRLTWLGGPCDSANTVVVDDRRSSLVLVQPECTGDAIGFDRVLLLGFDTPTQASSFRATLQPGGDTPG